MGFYERRLYTLGVRSGMTLVEVMVALGISGLAVGGIVTGYVSVIKASDKWALSLTANARASERIEQTRAARWDTSVTPAIDEVVASNFPDEVVTLDLAGTGTNWVYATNFTQISTISTNPPLRRIHVDCVWSFNGYQLQSNSLETCRAPDQ